MISSDKIVCNYDENFEIIENYRYYLIIIIGLKYNIKYFEVFNDKCKVIERYKTIFYDKAMCEKDFRGLNIPNGIGIFSGFNNNYGIINLIGFNDNFDDIWIGFTDKSHNNMITISTVLLDNNFIFNYKKILNYKLSDVINLKK